MGYQTDPRRSLRIWHVPGRSDITQPPMYGHALRVLAERGFKVEHMYEAATRGLIYLFDHRSDPASGLIRVVHPWETGCDDSNRWDGCLRGRFRPWRWYLEKRALVRSIRLVDEVAADNPRFDVCSAGFNALVAFNARELGLVTRSRDLLERASALAEAIEAQWVPAQRTWADRCLSGRSATTATRTLDGLLPALFSGEHARVDTAFAELFSPAAFWRPYGPAGTALDETSYDPDAYWRGPSWPQLTYLMMIAAQRQGRSRAAELLAEALIRGSVSSGYAEYWNPESGAGRGAIPQGWAALAWEGVCAL